jgi:DNA-binding NarL/FixJ family response regulator
LVTILVFDRQSIWQTSISHQLRRVFPGPTTRVADFATEAELVANIAGNPGAILFLGQISLDSKAIRLARELSCPVVWIAERKDAYLPLLSLSGICAIIFRTAKPADLAECIAALRERRTWIQSLDGHEAKSPLDEKWSLLTAKERNVTALMVGGMKYKDIATLHGTTCQVIKNKISLIYDKLGVRDRFSLQRAFLQSSLTCEDASAEAPRPVRSAGARLPR